MSEQGEYPRKKFPAVTDANIEVRVFRTMGFQELVVADMFGRFVAFVMEGSPAELVGTETVEVDVDYGHMAGTILMLRRDAVALGLEVES